MYILQITCVYVCMCLYIYRCIYIYNKAPDRLWYKSFKVQLLKRFAVEWFLLTHAFLTSCEFLTIKLSHPLFLIQVLKQISKIQVNYQTKQVFFILLWYWLIGKCWKQFCLIIDISTSTSAESQIYFGLATQPLIPNDKLLLIITYQDSSTNTIEEGKETFIHVIIQSLKDHVNSLENQLKDKQKIIYGLFNLNKCQCLVNLPLETISNKKQQKMLRTTHNN